MATSLSFGSLVLMDNMLATPRTIPKCEMLLHANCFHFCTIALLQNNTFLITTKQILIVMSHKILQMEAKSPAATSVTLGSHFLEIKTEPVNLMNSGQGVIQIVVMHAMAWVIIFYDRHLHFCTSLKCNT